MDKSHSQLHTNKSLALVLAIALLRVTKTLSPYFPALTVTLATRENPTVAPQPHHINLKTSPSSHFSFFHHTPACQLTTSHTASSDNQRDHTNVIFKPQTDRQICPPQSRPSRWWPRLTRSAYVLTSSRLPLLINHPSVHLPLRTDQEQGRLQRKTPIMPTPHVAPPTNSQL